MSAATLSPLPLAAHRAVANKANASHSTGPVTAEGKLASSRNALSHGLCSHDSLLPTEDPAAYRAHHLRAFARFQPETDTQSELVAEYADLAWRLKRIPQVLANLVKVEILMQSNDAERGTEFAARTPQEQVAIAEYLLMQSKKLQNVWTHEARIHRRVEKIAKQLQAEIAERPAPQPIAAPKPEQNRKNEPISAPPPRPIPFVRALQPGRNELCPCKSGLKFKRCCLNKPQTVAAAA